MLILHAYCSKIVPTPPYDDRIGDKWSTWRRLTKHYKMPHTVRRVVLRGIRYGSKLGFELEPPNASFPPHEWESPEEWNAAAVASIKAIENGIWNVQPTNIKRWNKFFVIDTMLHDESRTRATVFTLVSQETGPRPSGGMFPISHLTRPSTFPSPRVHPVPPSGQIPLWREIFHASSTSHANRKSNVDLHVHTHTCIPQWLHRHKPQIDQNANVLGAPHFFLPPAHRFLVTFPESPQRIYVVYSTPMLTRCCVDVAKATLVPFSFF